MELLEGRGSGIAPRVLPKYPRLSRFLTPPHLNADILPAVRIVFMAHFKRGR